MFTFVDVERYIDRSTLTRTAAEIFPRIHSNRIQQHRHTIEIESVDDGERGVRVSVERPGYVHDALNPVAYVTFVEARLKARRYHRGQHELEPE